MTQSLVQKRQNIASEAVVACKQLWEAMETLQDLQLQAVQAGNFLDSDFANTSLPQLTGFMVGLMLTVVTPGLATLMATALPGNGPIPRDIILQMLS